MRTLGRGLQAFGLILLPAGLLYGATSQAQNALGVEFGALAVGAAAFLLGTALARRER